MCFSSKNENVNLSVINPVESAIQLSNIAANLSVSNSSVASVWNLALTSHRMQSTVLSQKYNPKIEDVGSYLDQFDCFMHANGVENAMKSRVLLACVGMAFCGGRNKLENLSVHLSLIVISMSMCGSESQFVRFILLLSIHM